MSISSAGDARRRPRTRTRTRTRTVCELDVSPIVPSYGSDFRRRPLLRGVPRVGSPTSSLVLRRSDFSSPRPRSLSLARSFPACVGGDETSQVPGQPLRACLGLRSRRSRCAEVPSIRPVSSRTDGAFRVHDRVGLRNIEPLGTRPLGPHARCLRFVGPSRCARRKTRFQLVTSALAGRDPHPRAAHRNFRTLLPSFPARLGLAHLGHLLSHRLR